MSTYFLHFQMDFKARLHLVLDGRRKYAWGEQIGLNRGVIAGMFDKGTVPGWPALSAIRRAENLNPSWLADGEGSPYFVHRHFSDDDCAEAVAEHLAEGSWACILASSLSVPPRLAVCLHQPARYQVVPKEGDPFWVDYTVLEVFTGAGRATVDLLAERLPGRLRHAALTHEQFSALAAGEVGTWRLLLAPDAWLAGAQPVAPGHPVLAWPRLEDSPLAPSEQALVQAYRAMEPSAQEHYLAIARAMAGKT